MPCSYASVLGHDVQYYNFFFRKKDARLKYKGRYSSLVFTSLIGWTEKFWDFWFNMCFKYRTEGSRKLLVTFLSTFFSAAASNFKVSALGCWYGTTIQKCCIHICCICCQQAGYFATATWAENNLWDVNFSF